MSKNHNRNVRVAVLVDVQNVFYGARDQFDGKLDFKMLMNKAIAGRSLVRAVAYCVTCPGTDPSAFHGTLRQHGFDIKEKFLKVIEGGGTKGNWDVGIAIDGVLIGSSCDVIVLVTGDGDFVDLVNYLKSAGKRVEAICFHGTAATELLQSVDQYSWVDEDMMLKAKNNSGEAPCRADILGRSDGGHVDLSKDYQE